MVTSVPYALFHCVSQSIGPNVAHIMPFEVNPINNLV